MSRLFVGIDPGLSGAIGILTEEGGAVAVHDMPVEGKEVAPTLLAALLGGGGLVTVEDVYSMPRQGVASTFSFGVSKGIMLGVVATLGLPMMRVSPAKWKRAMGVTSDKRTSLRLARERWPNLGDDLRLVKHDGRAEALLLAEYGRRIGLGTVG